MYFRSRKILVFLSSSLFLTVAADIIIYFKFIFRTGVCTCASICLSMSLYSIYKCLHTTDFSLSVPGTPIHVCSEIEEPNKLAYLFWIPLICLDILLLIMTLYKGYDSLKSIICNKSSKTPSALMDVLIRTSLLYFTVYVV